MSSKCVRCLALAVVAAAGCGKAAEEAKAPAPVVPVRIVPGEVPKVPDDPHTAPAPRPAKERPFVGFRRVAGTKDEQARFVSHIPEPIRKLYGSDFTLFKDLGGVAYAWEFGGGPFRLWVEFEEDGQSTVPKRYPPQDDDWLVKAETGRVIFWARRGVSDKVNSVLERANKPTGDTSAVGLGVVVSGDAWLEATVGYKNPLWYGWKPAGVNDRPSEVVPMPDFEPFAVQAVSATEDVEGGAKPRRAKLTLYAQRVKPD